MPGWKSQLGYDSSDSETLNASDQVGAILKSELKEFSMTGALCSAKSPISFVDGDVTVGTDLIAEVSHGFNTGDKVQLTSSGTLPAGLSLATDYYVILVDADSFKLAASESDAYAGSPVDITAAAGGGTHTMTHFPTERSALDVSICTPLSIQSEGVYNEDAAHSSGDKGSHMLAVRQDTLAGSTDTDGDYMSLKGNSKGEIYVIDTDANASLDAIEVDIAAIEVELLDQGTTLDGIKTDTAAMVVDLAAIEVELLDQGTTLDTIAGDTTSMDGILTALSKDEDSVHSSGDQGVMGLAVRNDTLASLVDTDGDYAPLQVNASGALYVTGDGEFTTSDAALANTAIANAANGVVNVEESLVASALSNRKYLFAQNLGNKNVYIGGAGVNSTNGFEIPAGAVIEMRAGASVDVKIIAVDASSQDIRTLELS